MRPTNSKVLKDLENYNKIDWESIQKQKHSAKSRPLSSKKKKINPESVKRLESLAGYKLKKWQPEAKTRISKRVPSMTLLSIKPKRDWSFEEWQNIQSHELINKLTDEQLKLKFKEFNKENRKVGKLKPIDSRNEDCNSDRQNVNMIKTTYHVKTVKDKAKMMERMARVGNSKKIARSRYRENMTEVMWAGEKVKLRKWHESMDFDQNNIVFAMDPQVGFRKKSEKMFSSRLSSPRNEEQKVPELASLRSNNLPEYSIPDFIVSSVVTLATSPENEKKVEESVDATLANQDVVIAMAHPPPPSLLKRFLESHTVDLAYGLERSEMVKGSEIHEVFHNLLSMFSVNKGNSPPNHSQTEQLSEILQNVVHQRFLIESSGAMTQRHFRNLVMAVQEVDEVELEIALLKLIPQESASKNDLINFLSSRTTDLTFEKYDEEGTGELHRNTLPLMVYDLVSKFDAYTSGIYPDEEETEKTTQLLVDKFTELYLQDEEKTISKELFRKLPGCLDPMIEPELQKAFDADCQVMTLRAAQFHDKNLNENYVEDINARNFVDFLKSTPVVLCFDSLDIDNRRSLPASQLRPIADSLIRIYALQVGVEIPQEENLEVFKDELECSYRERHQESVLKRDEIDDISDCVLEVKNETVAQVLKQPVDNEHFSKFLKALPLEVAERRRIKSSDTAEIFHEVISMYNVAQGGCRLFPDETVRTTTFLTELVEGYTKANKPSRTRLSIILEEVPKLQKELETSMREDMMELISVPTQVSSKEHLGSVPSLHKFSDGKLSVSGMPSRRQKSVELMLKNIFSDDEGKIVDVSDQVLSSILMHSSPQSSANFSFTENAHDTADVLIEGELKESRKLAEAVLENDDNFESKARKMKTIQEEKASTTHCEPFVTRQISDEDCGAYYVVNNNSNPEDPLINKTIKKKLLPRLFVKERYCCVTTSLLLLICVALVVIFSIF